MNQIAELIKRVEGLQGPSREVDARIWCLLNPGAIYKDHFEAYGRPRQTQVEFTEPPKRTRLVTGGHRPHADDWTASLDAVVALIERVRPGWHFDVSSTHTEFLSPGELRYSADLAGPVSYFRDEETGCEDLHYPTAGARGATPALALLLALLRSMESDHG